MFKKIIFWIRCKRIGPDIPLTHFLLYSKSLGKYLCRKKFYFFGDNSEFRAGAYAVETDKISIGKNVTIRPGTMLFASPLSNELQIIIEDYVLIGSGVHFYTANHNFESLNTPVYFQGEGEIKRILLKKGCWIGAGSIILPGVTVGVNSVIGAGSIVTKSVPDYSVAVGNPAKVIREL